MTSFLIYKLRITPPAPGGHREDYVNPSKASKTARQSKPLINISSYYYSESRDKQKRGQGYVRAHTWKDLV